MKRRHFRGPIVMKNARPVQGPNPFLMGMISKEEYIRMERTYRKWCHEGVSCYREPKKLKALACDVEFGNGNNLLHQLVLDNSPLESSVRESYVGAVLRIISGVPKGLVNAPNNDERTPLYLAVLKNDLRMVRLLLSRIENIDVNQRCDSRDWGTALHRAAESGYTPIVRELLQRGGARVNERRSSGETPICLAMQAGHLDVVKVLVSEGANLTRPCCIDTPLCHAAERGDLEAAKFLISSGVDVNLEEDGDPALVLAAETGKLATVELLVSNGANVHATKDQGRTALHEAVRSGSLDVVEYLVNRGFNVNAETNFKQTPLDFAVEKGNIEIAAFLRDHGAVNGDLKPKIKIRKKGAHRIRSVENS